MAHRDTTVGSRSTDGEIILKNGMLLRSRPPDTMSGTDLARSLVEQDRPESRHGVGLGLETLCFTALAGAAFGLLTLAILRTRSRR
jgi:hypothetical protein